LTTKDPLHKQIVISIDSKNISKFIALSDNYVANLNYALKGIKSDTSINFIYSNHHSLIIMLNKIISPSELSMVENYIKNAHFIDLNNIQTT